MWETLLDALERRYRRREGVSDEDLARVRKSSGAPAIANPSSMANPEHRATR